MRIKTELVKGLNESACYIYENNKAKGFWDKPRNVGELLMLVTSELAEALEAQREDKFASMEEFDKSHTPESFKAYIKDSFEDEIADAIIRLLDLCGGLQIDIERHIQLKVAYNETRQRLHGKSF